MKKLLAVILFALSLPAFAKDTVTIYYAFGPADTMANYSRTLVTEANRIQDKYTFVFDTKPGAGNAIAANYVKNNPNSILATASPFWIRPIFYPNESYNINDFRELLPQCDPPIAVASLKYKSWKEVPTDRPLTIGTSGLGVTTHLVAVEISKRFPNLQVVPFKSANDAILATAGGQTDFAVGFISDQLRWTTKDTPVGKRLTILGVTGNRSIDNIQPLVKQGFPSLLASMSAPHHLVVPNTIPEAKFKEWRDILFRASKAKSVQDSYQVDYAVPLDSITDDNIQPWFYQQNVKWKKVSTGIKIEK